MNEYYMISFDGETVVISNLTEDLKQQGEWIVTLIDSDQKIHRVGKGRINSEMVNGKLYVTDIEFGLHLWNTLIQEQIDWLEIQLQTYKERLV